MTKRNTDFTLTKLDDLFTMQEQRDDAKLERVQNILLCELHPFKNHPFKVQNDEEMKRMIESIKKSGQLLRLWQDPLTADMRLSPGTDDLRLIKNLGLKLCR